MTLYKVKNILLFIAIYGFLIGCSPQKTTSEYQQSAQQLITEKNYNSAIIELKNAVQAEPKNAKSRFMLGQSYFYKGDVNGAQKEFNRALELGFDANKVQPMLLRSNLLLGDKDAIMKTLTSEQPLHPATQTELNTIAGIGLTYLGYGEQGQQLLATTLNEGEEQNIYFKLAKAWVAGNNEQIAEAITLTESLLAQDTEFDDAEFLLANLYAVDKQYELAISNLESYITKHPYNYLVKLNYISALIRADKLDLAEAQTDKLLQRYPNSAVSNEFKAEISLRNSQFKAAAEYAGIALTNQPNLFKSNLIAGIGHYKTDNYEMAYHHLALIENRLAPNHLGNQILSMVKLKLGYTDEAIAAIDALDHISEKDFGILASASLALLRKGNNDKAAEYIKRMDSIETSDSQTLSKRGVFKLSIADKSGIEDLKQAIAIDPNYDQARLALLYNYLKNNQFQQAMTVANTWVNDFPNKENGYLAQGIVWRKQKNDESAIASFNLALDKNPNSLGALYNLALFDVKQKKYIAAYKKLTGILDQNFTHKGALDVLVRITDKFADKDKVIIYLDSLIASTDDKLLLQVVRAKALENIGKRELAMTELDKLEQQAIGNDLYLSIYANMASSGQQFDLAERLYLQQIKNNSSSYRAYIGLLSSFEAQDKYQQAYTYVKKAQQQFPNQEKLKLYEANYLLLSKSYSQAKTVIDTINPDAVDSNMLLQIKTQYYFKVADFQQAMIHAEQSYQQKPDQKNSFVYAQSLQKLGQIDKAKDIIENTLIEHPDSIVLKNLLAELNIEINPEDSLAFYQEMSQKNPDNFIVLNNLAWAAIKAENFPLGLQSAQKAADLAQHQPQVLDTLAVAQMKMGQFEKANKLLEKVQKLLPDNQEVLLHYCESLIHVNQLSEAEVLLSNISDSAEKQLVLGLLSDKKG